MNVARQKTLTGHINIGRGLIDHELKAGHVLKRMIALTPLYRRSNDSSEITFNLMMFRYFSERSE